MSKKVELLLPDGSSRHIKSSIAYEMMRAGDAIFTDDTFRKAQAVPAILKPRGRNERFDEHWQMKPSGGILVWQFQP